MGKKKQTLFTILFLSIITSSFIQENKWLEVQPKAGDSIGKLLKRYDITDECSKGKFLELNDLTAQDNLLLDNSYKLPIDIKTYNGTSIRSSLSFDDYEKAKKIQDYNLKMFKKGVRKTDYRKSNLLWVPIHFFDCQGDFEDKEEEPKIKYVKEPLFGKANETVLVKNDKLKNCVYYLVSGHGGPDPGAMANVEKHDLCEDEYAYDVTLRLARHLLEQSATVYLIIQDKNDGIREESYLKCDKDEICIPNQAIPINQVKRLRQRAAAVNTLYKKHKEKAKKQRCIVIHVDSRSKKEQIDVFFYHHKYSKTGKALAKKIQDTFEKKYDKYQKGRGYGGEVTHRNLYMLTKTSPVTCYIELGNIQHLRDRKRILQTSNRQALANWIGEALSSEK